MPESVHLCPDSCPKPRHQRLWLQILTSRPPSLPEGLEVDAQAMDASRLHLLRLAVMPRTRTSRRLEDLQASFEFFVFCLSFEGVAAAVAAELMASQAGGASPLS